MGVSKNKYYSVKQKVDSQLGLRSADSLSITSVRNPRKRNRLSYKLQRVVGFLFNLADVCGEKLPHKEVFHLPFPSKKHVFLEMAKSFHLDCDPLIVDSAWDEQIYHRDAIGVTNHREDEDDMIDLTLPQDSEGEDEFQGSRPKRIDQKISYDYFLKCWTANCDHIKLRRHNEFSHCSECINLENFVLKAHSVEDKKRAQIFIKQHKKMYMNEKMVYYKNRELPVSDPSVISMIVDGADQSAYGLPHFHRRSKESRGMKMKTKMYGVICHKRFNMLCTVPMNGGSGSNLCIEVIHRALLQEFLYVQKNGQDKAFPSKLVLQLDNTCSQNKNNYLFAYLQSLVEMGIFSTVEVNFLPVGHTHEDIDQLFSRMASIFASHNAISRTQLLALSGRLCPGQRMHFEHVDAQANWHDHLDSMASFKKMSNITKPQSFKFEKDLSTGKFRCMVKELMQDADWLVSLHNLESEPHSFFSEPLGTHTEFFKNFPANKVEPIDPEVVANIEAEVRSCYERMEDMRCPEAVTELADDLENLKKTHIQEFNWNLALYETLTTNERHVQQVSTAARLDQECLEHLWILDRVRNRSGNMYEVGDFLIVACDAEEGPFWVAEVSVPYVKGTCEEIQIVWYQTSQQQRDPSKGTYRKVIDRSTKRPHTGIVELSTVLTSFPGLLPNGKIPMEVLRRVEARKRLCGAYSESS